MSPLWVWELFRDWGCGEWLDCESEDRVYGMDEEGLICLCLAPKNIDACIYIYMCICFNLMDFMHFKCFKFYHLKITIFNYK